ncbi:MAG: 50S ribosomal protein L4, partial [Candidatus Heimdallarchaeaceae archaeon]
SAIAATANKDLVLKRGHVLDENIASLPIIIDSEFENLQSTSEVFSVLKKLNLHLDLERVEKTKRIRAGVGKRRGRKYKIGKGPLIVVGEESKLYKAARNIPGVDVISVKNL